MTTDLDQFRQSTREWLEANCPASMRQATNDGDATTDSNICWGGKKFIFESEDQKTWLHLMADKGWTVPTWPKDYGGAGLSKDEAKVLAKEMRRINARSPLNSFGIWMLGPALLKYGTEAQKLDHLPKIARGEIRWAQGYSEPNAGSDLASIMTKCEDAGDHYTITGQKVWTSYAHQADWIFALVRTDPTAKKHEGISFILVDMDQPGVSTKPIRLISGTSPFCETFFDGARAEKDAIVGDVNKGWSVAKYLLSHEREMIGGLGGNVMQPLGDVAARQIGVNAEGQLSDPILRTDVARAEIDGLAFMASMEKITAEAKAGQGMGANASHLKYYGTEFNKRRLELMMNCAGHEGLEWKGADDVAATWLRTKANSIEGGTSEVQLNIVAKHILELPA